MQTYSTLHELLSNDERSRQLFHTFTPQQQIALEEQRQNIHTLADLEQYAQGLQKQKRSWRSK